MNKKVLAVIAVLILVVAWVGLFHVVKKEINDKEDEVPVMDSASLKVFGNVNGDRYITQSDADTIKDLISQGKTVKDYPLADANQDGKLDQSDVDVVQNIVDRKSTTIYHVNYHDTKGNGVMEEEIIRTKYPISSAITTLSSDMAIMLYSIGIVDQIAGASYSNTLDTSLYGDTYINIDKVVKLGSNSDTIDFTNGRAGSTDVISEKGVTAVVAGWNNLSNESNFEDAGIDVVRVATSTVDETIMTHSTLLLGLLFGCSEKAEKYLDMSLEVLKYVEGKLEKSTDSLTVASTSNGYLSSPKTQYSQLIKVAGGSNPLPETIFGTSASVSVTGHPEVYDTEFNYIVHIRTTVNYDQDKEALETYWKTYTNPFSGWKYSSTGQYLVSGTIPVALRVAYIAAAIHSDLVSSDAIDTYHQRFADTFYADMGYKISDMTFLVSSSTFGS